MSVSSRRTYDTDLITLRRIFAYDLSNSPFSTGYILTAVTKGVATFLDANFALSTIGVPNLPAQLSTLDGELLSTLAYFNANLPSSASFFLPSTVTGLGSSGYVSTSYLTSTIEGLGTFGYLSSAAIAGSIQSSIIGLGSAGYISTASFYSTFNSAFPSTVEGLGSAGYISTASFYSTFNSAFPSTVKGLGSAGYISSLSFFSSLVPFENAFPSTVEGLGTAGYISSLSFYSTIDNLTSYGFVSSMVSSVRSTFSNSWVGNWCNVGFLYSNLGPLSSIKTFEFDIGDGMRNVINPSTTNLDIEVKANLQLGYYDSRSIQYDFSTCLVRGVSVNTSTIIAQENISYYILNASPVNLPFFFTEKYRFLINNRNIIDLIKNSSNTDSVFSVFHVFGISSPTTNQLFVSPARPTSVTVVLDNTTQTLP